MQGRYDLALELYEQSLAIALEVGDRYGEGQMLMNMGGMARWLGDVATARQRWQEALAALDGLGVPEEQQVRQWLAELD